MGDGAGAKDVVLSVAGKGRLSGATAAARGPRGAVRAGMALGLAVVAALGLLAVLAAHGSGREAAAAAGPAGGPGLTDWRLARMLQADGGPPQCDVQACTESFAGCGCTQLAADKEVWMIVLEWALIVLLVCMSALFSGLTLGLMSLDKIGLEIVIGGDPESKDAEYAQKIQPIRECGNLLLCTLLLGNVSVNAALSILLADYTSGALGFVLSTAVIVIFGEIFPQAACSRHALMIGAKTLFIVKFFLVLMYPIAKPISWVLDRIFREELGSIYSSAQLNKLVEIHLKHQMVDEDQAKMMGGALNYKDTSVSDIMTAKRDIFMLKVTDSLDFETMTRIFQTGFSRIPVYENDDRNQVVGLLFTKDLILVDPEDRTTVRSVVQFFGRPLHYLWVDTKLSEALTLFRSGRTHLALVQDVNNQDPETDPFYEVVGLVTLEDIIELILQEDILDETDQSWDRDNSTDTSPVAKTDRLTFDFARLRLLDAHNTQNELSQDEVKAIVAHLSANLPIFAGALKRGEVTADQVRDLVTTLPVLQLKEGEKLYIKGKPVTHCTLVLSGRLDILSGKEGFASFTGPWSLVGQGALDLDNPSGYGGDFSATVTSEEGLRCIRISRYDFENMRDANDPNKAKQPATPPSGSPASSRQLRQTSNRSSGGSSTPPRASATATAPVVAAAAAAAAAAEPNGGPSSFAAEPPKPKDGGAGEGTPEGQ